MVNHPGYGIYWEDEGYGIHRSSRFTSAVEPPDVDLPEMRLWHAVLLDYVRALKRGKESDGRSVEIVELDSEYAKFFFSIDPQATLELKALIQPYLEERAREASKKLKASQKREEQKAKDKALSKEIKKRKREEDKKVREEIAKQMSARKEWEFYSFKTIGATRND